MDTFALMKKCPNKGEPTVLYYQLYPRLTPAAPVVFRIHVVVVLGNYVVDTKEHTKYYLNDIHVHL